MNCVGGPDGELQEQTESGCEMAEIDGLRQQNHELKRANCGMARLVDGLRQQLAATENTILELRHELTETWTRTDGQRTRLEKQRDALRYALKRLFDNTTEYEMQLLKERDEVIKQRDEYLARVRSWEEDHRQKVIHHAGDVARLRAIADERDTLKAELERVYAHNHDLEDAIAMGEHTVEVLEERLATARGQIERYRELARWIERDMMTPARNTCHVPWDALDELVALAHGAEPPDCAVCRREDCWPDCARFYDKPVGATGEVEDDG